MPKTQPKTKKKQQASGAPAGFGRRIGPLPIWAWALVIGGALGLVMLVRARRNAGSTTTNSPVGYPTDPSAQALAPMAPTTGGAIGGNPTVIERMPTDLVEALLLPTAFMSRALVDQGATLGGIAVNAQNAMAGIASYGIESSFSLAQTALAVGGGGGGGGGGNASTSGANAIQPKATAQPYGGAPKVTKLANGTTRWEYPNGRVVLQAPGKNKYVAKAGS